MKLVITRQLYCNREIKLLKLKANYNLFSAVTLAFMIVIAR